MGFKWREDHTILVLDLLKNEECLWNIRSPSYRNKNVRDKALERMAKRLNLQGVTPEDVKLKIKSIRTRYSSELGKVLLSEKSCARARDVYKPKLFWFSQADMFLRSVCHPRPASLLSLKDQDPITEIVSDTEESGNQDAENFCKVKAESFDEQPIVEQPIIELPIIEQSISSNVKQDSSRNEFDPEINVSRKRAFLGEPVEMCRTTLGMRNEGISEFDAVGINVAKKLAKMEPMQAVYAESLISVVLRKGLLNQLNDDTDICKLGCS